MKLALTILALGLVSALIGTGVAEISSITWGILATLCAALALSALFWRNLA